MYREKMIFAGTENLPDFSVWQTGAMRTGNFVPEMVICSESRQKSPIGVRHCIPENIII